MFAKRACFLSLLPTLLLASGCKEESSTGLETNEIYAVLSANIDEDTADSRFLAIDLHKGKNLTDGVKLEGGDTIKASSNTKPDYSFDYGPIPGIYTSEN